MDKELRHKLLDYLLKILGRRPYSIKEIEQKLTQYLYKKKISLHPQSQAEIFDFLKEKKLLDDVEFARWFVSQREDFRPKSKRGIAFELKLKGISEEITNEALVNYSEEEAIRKIIAKKSFLPKEKLISYLFQQGFSYEAIKNVIQ